uniref:Consortin N-terminal domain-containing protein n=1 Tax=Magallana gigas TaxID=29159 RepID=K1QC03_MAGGI
MEKEKATGSESKSEATKMIQNKEDKDETTEDPTKKNEDKLAPNLDTKTQEVNIDGTPPMSEPCAEVSDSSNEDNKKLLNPQRLPGDGEHQLGEGPQKTAQEEEEVLEEDDEHHYILNFVLDEKAIHFIQAEKIYYESALIDTTDIQMKLEEAQKDQPLPSDVTEDTIRADEFEELAKICLDKKQPQLALEYAGKATKIRQSILGDNHPVTISSLDFFTKVYAEAGADQYQDSMKRFENQGAGDPSDQDVETMIPQSSEREPQSILRRRKPGERDAEKRVRFDDSVKKSEDEEQCAKIFLWILFAICGVILLILGVYLYCHISSGSSCQSYKHQIKHVWDRIKYYYYHYTQSKLRKFV